MAETKVVFDWWDDREWDGLAPSLAVFGSQSAMEQLPSRNIPLELSSYLKKSQTSSSHLDACPVLPPMPTPSPSHSTLVRPRLNTRRRSSNRFGGWRTRCGKRWMTSIRRTELQFRKQKMICSSGQLRLAGSLQPRREASPSSRPRGSQAGWRPKRAARRVAGAAAAWKG